MTIRKAARHSSGSQMSERKYQIGSHGMGLLSHFSIVLWILTFGADEKITLLAAISTY